MNEGKGNVVFFHFLGAVAVYGKAKRRFKWFINKQSQNH